MIKEVTQTINLIIAPVVMITASILMVNGLIIRYGSLGELVRSVNRELLNLHNVEPEQNQTIAQRLQELQYVLPDLLKHHHFVHDALVLAYLSILTFMLDMLIIAIAVASNINWLSQMALIVFLIGVSILCFAMVLVAYELRTSHDSLQLEVRRTCRLCAHQHNKPGRN